MLLYRVSQIDFNLATVRESLTQEHNQLHSRCITPFTAAVTFDDNPNDLLPELLKLLDKYNATATFFPNAPYHFRTWNLDLHLRIIHSNGHQIGAHTWDHLDMKTIDTLKALKDINTMNEWLNTTLGIQSSYVRPPYGECHRTCRETLSSHGFTAVRWSLDTFDWKYESNETGSSSLKILESWVSTQDKLPEDQRTWPIVLMHARKRNTIKFVAPALLEALSARGFRFVSVAECLGHSKDQWYY
ncbi:hypothetical protein BKA66DRAFT_573508 [Pyrenochaeta sp. MPI-SDFR-AT-0127]|nr:hypothetical protein BKA66DRAFT_573508 [Pyrenochaeta sp. MPI-SDFR-AT-0127]